MFGSLAVVGGILAVYGSTFVIYSFDVDKPSLLNRGISFLVRKVRERYNQAA
jgi:hypothetical protein